MGKTFILFGLSVAIFTDTSFSADKYNEVEELEPLLTVLPKTKNYFASTRLATPINSDGKIAVPATFAELINTTPSVSQNGQGGHFQNFSIRGVSRHRIKTLVNGIRIESDRRAGVSASFIDPLLIGDALVWRAPASVQFGSGALGGAVQIQSYGFTSSQVMAGYNSLGNEHYQVLGIGEDNYSIGVARREAANANAANGDELNTHFTQYSAVVSTQYQWEGLTFDVFALPALALDVGKSNIDYPTRMTNYPKEKHLLLKVGVSSDAGWSSAFYIHPNALETNVHKVKKSTSKISNNAFNLGGNLQIEKSFGKYTALIGMDYFARRKININEKLINRRTGSVTRSRSLNDGEENELGVFSSVNWTWGDAELQSGIRFSYINQSQQHVSTENETAWSGFLGISYPFENGLSLSADFATGFRFPSLSERFFTGTTGRGEVIGNPDLKMEQSMNIDLGAKWQGSNLTLGANIFYLQVSDYIERVEISDNVLSFVNLSDGRIMGAELDSRYLINDQLSFTWSGHFLEGRSDHGNPLSDVPSNRMLFGLEYKIAKWESSLKLEMRDDKNDPGNGEKNINSAQLLSAVIRYRPDNNLLFSVSGSNLLNEKYFNSADRKSTFAVQRSIGFNASWQM